MITMETWTSDCKHFAKRQADGWFVGVWENGLPYWIPSDYTDYNPDKVRFESKSHAMSKALTLARAHRRRLAKELSAVDTMIVEIKAQKKVAARNIRKKV